MSCVSGCYFSKINGNLQFQDYLGDQCLTLPSVFPSITLVVHLSTPLGFQCPSKGRLSDSYTEESTILISEQFSTAIVSHCQMEFCGIFVTLRQKRRLVYSTQYCSVLIPIVVLERMSLVEFALCSVKLPLQWIQPHAASAPGERLCASQSGWAGRNT